MIPPMSDDERNVCEKYGIVEFPAILFFDKQEWDDSQKPVTLFQGQLNTGVYQIKLELTIRNTTATIFNLANFKSVVLETNVPTSPTAVTFYSHRNQRSLDYINIIDKAIKEFGRIDPSFQFGFVNLVDGSEVVFRHVNASLVSAVPFTIIFWQSKHQDDSKYIIKQALFNQGIPTSLNLYAFVQSNNIPLLVDTDMDTDWLDVKLEVCDKTANQENECVPRDNMTVVRSSYDSLLLEDTTRVYGPEPAPAEWKAIKMVGSANVSTDVKIPVVTDQTWAAKIEQSVRPTNAYGPKGNQDSSRKYLVSLVVFIKGQCGYCTKIMPVLQDIANSVKMIGASMYLMNCTTDPVHCDQFGITGYPTLTAFRSLSWSVVEQCYPSSQQSHYIRVDYHGAIVPALVLDWLSNLNQPAVNNQYMHDHLPDDLSQDVYLVATVYTRSLARQYLPSRLIDRWYTCQCYTLVCELLYGLVPCYALYTRDVADHVTGTRNEKDLVVSKLVLHRNDGVRATIFELGYNLAFTLGQESDSRLHMFHKPHRYNVDDNFNCEDDHRMCTEYAVQFVHDHRRLPVTQITTAIFHTKTGSQDRTREVFTQDLPVMLILARTQNISRDTHFYREITVAAYSLYQDIVFTTLNVDEFSFWASNFVPKGYLTKYAHDLSGSAPSLYHYPRLCLVRWQDHQHAAFYPPVSEMERLGTRVQERLEAIDSQQIIKFARDFLEDPGKMLIRTEMF
ncbi:uncharacterized protein LOC116296034 [Actinia tenebrosa]|uniref:Uncharacterized protein LOC116296034 n=1 Tax=Actinia tenebrosa TaxID=6105 RepID=A0A6P8HX11_ACTTE|nr:uncharacterized protein LOC116296034 [Actinia tenebrosa]